MLSAAEYTKRILSRKTARDKQRLIGASNICNPCDRCLADDILERPREGGTYNMGAVLGTAIHAYLDERNTDPSAQREISVTLGEIPGYGVITSRTDLYIGSEKMSVDFKTTTRDKIKLYQRVVEQETASDYDTDAIRDARATLESYVYQVQLYAWGLVQKGLPVNRVAIVFIARDGQIIDRDVWGLELPYRQDWAVRAFQRAVDLYYWLQHPDNDPEDLVSAESCYYCNQVRPFVLPAKRKVSL